MKKLLVAIHPGFQNTPAVERALAFAVATDVDIMLYSAVYDEHTAGLRFGGDPALEKARLAALDSQLIKLTQIKSRFKDIANSVRVLADWRNSAAAGIVDAAHDFNADLIVVSSSRHSTLARIVLTNTDWEVMRRATIPVLFAHHHPNKPYKKIMAAVDPTHFQDEHAVFDSHLIETSEWICAAFSGELYLAHAYPSMRSFVEADFIPTHDLTLQWKNEHKRAVKKLAARHQIEETKIVLSGEHPRVAIPELATEINADLVVIGVRSRSTLHEFFLGHTAEFVLDHLDCDVLTVHATPVPASKDKKRVVASGDTAELMRE